MNDLTQSSQCQLYSYTISSVAYWGGGGGGGMKEKGKKESGTGRVWWGRNNVKERGRQHVHIGVSVVMTEDRGLLFIPKICCFWKCPLATASQSGFLLVFWFSSKMSASCKQTQRWHLHGESMARSPVGSSSAIHFQRDCLDWLHRYCLENLYHCWYSRQCSYTQPLLLFLHNPSHTKSAARPQTVSAIYSAQRLCSLL